MSSQKIVLVIGSIDDKVIQFFARCLDHRNQKTFCFIDQSLFGAGIHVCGDRWELASGRIINHNQVVGVWNRLVTLTNDQRSLSRAIEQYACFLMDEVYPGVLNRPKHGMSNHAKQYQIDCITTKRLQKVESCICANSLLDWGLRQQVLIRKSLSGIRSIVRVMSDKEKKLWVEVPELFQRYIDGLNIRVHVIKDKVVACCCVSDSVDYRYADKVSIHRFDLPEWLKKECIDISRQLSLPFSGIDIIKQGQTYYLLEVNPAPGYAYFDIDKSVSKSLQACLGG